MHAFGSEAPAVAVDDADDDEAAASDGDAGGAADGGESRPPSAGEALAEAPAAAPTA